MGRAMVLSQGRVCPRRHWAMSGDMEHHGREGKTCIQYMQAQGPATYIPTQQTPIQLGMLGAQRLRNLIVRII